MIVVHHLERSRSQRVLWLLEELEVPYEVRRYARDPKTLLAPSALRKVHPLGKSPVVTDGERTIAESGAILEYLVERYGGGRLRPAAGTPEHLRYRYWMHYAEGSAMPLLVMKLVFLRLPAPPAPLWLRPLLRSIGSNVIRRFIDPQLRLHLGFLEGELARDAHFAGAAFTAADIQMSFPIEAAAARGGLGAEHPRLANWLERMRARPAYRRAIERGGPFTVLGAD